MDMAGIDRKAITTGNTELSGNGGAAKDGEPSKTLASSVFPCAPCGNRFTRLLPMRAENPAGLCNVWAGSQLLAGLEFRKFGDRAAAIERVAPGIERVANGGQVKSTVPLGVGAEIPPSAFEHRTASD